MSQPTAQQTPPRGPAAAAATSTPAASKFVPRRVTKNMFRILGGYVLVIGAGLSVFYFAKREVNDNRVRDMKAKQEMIQKQAQFPTRIEILTKEKEQERLKRLGSS